MRRRDFLTGAGAVFALAGCVARPQAARLAPGTTLYVLRHADRDGTALSRRGRSRARALVAALEGDPLDAIHSPDIDRNLATAQPLAAARGLPVDRRPAADPAPRLVAEAAGRAVLWVGNKDNIVAIWQALELPGPPPLSYGDLHVIRADDAGRVRIERRRFGPE